MKPVCRIRVLFMNGVYSVMIRKDVVGFIPIHAVCVCVRCAWMDSTHTRTLLIDRGSFVVGSMRCSAVKVVSKGYFKFATSFVIVVDHHRR